MNSLIIASTRNRLLMHDGDEFGREADACWRTWSKRGDSQIVKYDAKGGVRKRDAVAHIFDIYDGPPLDAIAFFCHGMPRSLDNAWNMKNVKRLAAAMAPHCSSCVDVVLYACSCGKYSNGFGVELSERLDCLEVDATIWAHTTAGHTSRNPNVVICHPCGELQRVFPAANKAQRKLWAAALREGDFRFRFPLMFEHDIVREVIG